MQYFRTVLLKELFNKILEELLKEILHEFYKTKNS